MALGAVFLLRTTPLLAAFHIPFLADTKPLLGWPDGHAHFMPFIPALPDALLAALCIARTLAAVAFMIGVRARVAGLLAGGLGYVTVLQDPARFFTTHHVIFLGTMLLACTDAVSACALRPGRTRSPASSAWLIRAWVASIYVWAAIAKLRPDWFDGRTFALLAREGQFRPFVASTLLCDRYKAMRHRLVRRRDRARPRPSSADPQNPARWPGAGDRISPGPRVGGVARSLRLGHDRAAAGVS